jgi:hypothetical protein
MKILMSGHLLLSIAVFQKRINYLINRTSKKKAAEFNSAAFKLQRPGTRYQRTPPEKMMLSNVRFKVLLVKFLISMPG